MKLSEHKLAHTLLDGLQGLEIGGASHNSFGLNTRNVAPHEQEEFYAEHEKTYGNPAIQIDIYAYADNIPLPDSSEDFIISSHVVEHLPNVITTFIEWNRIVKNGGYIFMIVPLRNALPLDVNREITSFAHFIEDYTNKVNIDSHTIEGVPGGRMGHYHVFTPDSLHEVVSWMNAEKLVNWELVAREDKDTKVGNGFTLVYKKI